MSVTGPMCCVYDSYIQDQTDIQLLVIIQIAVHDDSKTMGMIMHEQRGN